MVTSTDECSVGRGRPSVVVAVAHPTLRRLILELLEQDPTHWQLHPVADRLDLAATVAAAGADLVVLEDQDTGWCCELHPDFVRQHVIVIGPEPDPAYERAARGAGAGAWLCRDRIGEELISSMCGALARSRGATHDSDSPCASST